jgi:hypothetical protein
MSITTLMVKVSPLEAEAFPNDINSLDVQKNVNGKIQ